MCGGVRFIIIEFGGCNIDSRTYFRDFWNLLNKDYNIYLMMRDGMIRIYELTEEIEIFLNCTFMFERKR